MNADPSAATATEDESLPCFGDYVWVGEGGGGQYEFDPIKFCVFDVAPMGEYLAMTGFEVYDLTEEEIEEGEPRIGRQKTVLARRAGVTVTQRLHSD